MIKGSKVKAKQKTARHKAVELSSSKREFELERALRAGELEAKLQAARISELEQELESAARDATGQSERSTKLDSKLRKLESKLNSAEFRTKVQAVKISELEQDCARLRSTRSATHDLLQAEIRSRDSEIIELKLKLELANKQLEWFRKAKFKGTKEDLNGDNGQPKENPKKAIDKTKRGQKPGSKGHGRNSKKADIETDVKFLEIPGCACGKCGLPYRLMNRTEASPLSEIEVKVLRTVYQRCIYVSQCDCEGRKIRVAEPPAKLFARTEIGNTLWAWLIVEKFLGGKPQNRILKQLSLWGLSLPAGTVTGGYQVINDLLEPLFEELVNHCRGADFWNADETTWRVFGEGKQRWWFWLIASDDTVVYLLDPSRSKKVPQEFFAGSAGILMTDRLASYKGLQESIRKAWCWAHMRRDIFNIYLGVPQLRLWAKAWLLEIAKLYVLNHQRLALWKEGKTEGEEWEGILKELSSHVEKLRQRWEKEVSKPNLHSEKSKVLRSLKRHWKGLTVFLEDPRIPLDNNRAERLLRNPVILRKNSFGSGAPWSGHFAAKIFSVFQTWLINGLDPQQLLLDYFKECSKTPGIPPPELNRFLPWMMSEERKSKYALPESYKQPG